ncbi:hypothetical protein BDI4_190096 [Burkholderia diffusa]|nr:hypothetical protein BDI4_190096 [Burkholderia diffusa]
MYSIGSAQGCVNDRRSADTADVKKPARAGFVVRFRCGLLAADRFSVRPVFLCLAFAAKLNQTAKDRHIAKVDRLAGAEQRAMAGLDRADRGLSERDFVERHDFVEAVFRIAPEPRAVLDVIRGRRGHRSGLSHERRNAGDSKHAACATYPGKGHGLSFLCW